MEVSIGSPLNIPEILHHIMKYVGSNPIDLLPCRLVNHTWNKLVTDLLKKGGNCVAIDQGNIKAYCTLLEKCQLERSSLNSSNQGGGGGGGASCERLNIIVILPRCHCDPLPLINGVKDLINKSNKCKVESIIDPQHPSGNDRFWQLLQLSSSTLKHLCLRAKLYDEIESESDESQESYFRRLIEKNRVDTLLEEEVLAAPITSFPNLECIQYIVHGFSKHEPTPTRFIKIIQSAPALQSIMIPVTNEHFEEEVVFLQAQQRTYVTKIIVGLVEPNNKLPLGLTNLEIPIYNRESLAALCQLVLPKLQTLKLHQQIVCVLSKSFCVFLAKNVPSLGTLDLFFLYPSTQPPADLSDFEPTFGRIPQITNVGIYTHLPEDSDILDTPNFYKSSLVTSAAIIALHFRGLTTVSTDIVVLKYLGFALKEKETKPIAGNLPTYFQRFYSNICFSNVTTLSINLDSSHNLNFNDEDEDEDDEDDAELVEMITTYMESMFLSSTKLILNHKDERPTDLDEWILDSGLKSVLRINGIQSLEVNNYFDWLPYLLDKWVSDDTLSNLRQNLKHLKFGDTRPNVRNVENSDATIGGGFSRRRRSDRRIIANIAFDDFLKLKTVQIQEKILRRSSSGKITRFGHALDFLNALRSRTFFPTKHFELYY